MPWWKINLKEWLVMPDGPQCSLGLILSIKDFQIWYNNFLNNYKSYEKTKN